MSTIDEDSARGPRPTRAKLWAGRLCSAVPVAMLLFSAAMKWVQPPGFEEGLTHLGWPLSNVIGLEILEIACTAVYLVPRTSVLGAILLTGYLGGAIAAHVRVGDAYVIQALLGVLVWLGLYLREPRLAALLPLRR
jgi:hypothetical protein